MYFRRRSASSTHTLPIAFALVLTFGWARIAAAQPCTNGSSTDCNPPGSTLIAASAFVDPAPPAGFVQCAGFVNTAGNDVAWNWEANCAAFATGPLFLRAYDAQTNALLAGARLFGPVADCWNPLGRTYRTDTLEG